MMRRGILYAALTGAITPVLMCAGIYATIFGLSLIGLITSIAFGLSPLGLAGNLIVALMGVFMIYTPVFVEVASDSQVLFFSGLILFTGGFFGAMKSYLAIVAAKETSAKPIGARRLSVSHGA